MVLRACGQAKLYLDGAKSGELPDGLDTRDLKIPPLEGPARFKIEYAPIADHFFLELLYDPGDGHLLAVPPGAFTRE